MTFCSKDLLKIAYLKLRKLPLSLLLLFRKTCLPKDGEIENIILLRHDRIGDMVLSTTMFKALKKRYPKARLTVLASEKNHPVIRNNPYVDEILIYKGIGWFIKEIRQRHFDLAIDPFLTYELSQALLTYLSGSKYRIGFEGAGREVFFNVKGPKLFPVIQFANHMLELIDFSGGGISSCAPEIFLTQEEIKWALKFLEDRGFGRGDLKIAIHPGAFYPSQKWPIEKFGQVAERIANEFGVKVLLLGDTAEDPLLVKIKVASEGDVEIFSGLNLRQFMALLSLCNLLVCNNSGPLHIASALKVPTVSLMGPTVVPLWLPYGNNHIVIRRDLACSPCNKAKCDDHSCMKLITVEEVVDTIGLQLKCYK